jgi:hypothetical protein
MTRCPIDPGSRPQADVDDRWARPSGCLRNLGWCRAVGLRCHVVCVRGWPCWSTSGCLPPPLPFAQRHLADVEIFELEA